LHTHFRDESIRKGYEDARDLIADLFGSQPDVPITQDSLAGYLADRSDAEPIRSDGPGLW
jgi:hypothetical protein